ALVFGDPERTRGRKYHRSSSNMFDIAADQGNPQPTDAGLFKAAWERPTLFAKVRAACASRVFRPATFASVQNALHPRLMSRVRCSMGYAVFSSPSGRARSP